VNEQLCFASPQSLGDVLQTSAANVHAIIKLYVAQQFHGMRLIVALENHWSLPATLRAIIECKP
jgi:hypothetical protein